MGVRRTRPSFWDRYGIVLITIVPVMVFVLVFFFLPVILTVAMAFTDMDHRFQWNWIGLDNFKMMFKDPVVPKVFKNTLFYVFATLLLFNVGAGLLIAIITCLMPPSIGDTFRLLWLLPRMTPPVVYYLLWLGITMPYPHGILNQILVDFLGMTEYKSVNWISRAPWEVVILANGFVGASFGMIIFSSSIRSIPLDIIRAAKVDGASTLRIIKDIIIPFIKWPVLFVTVYQTLSLLTSFEYILLLTDGGPGFYTTEVWALYVYHVALGGWTNRFGYGAALSLILVIVGLVLSFIYFRVFRFREMIIEPKIEV